MQVAVSVRRAVIVDNNVDTLHINATTKDICRNEDTLFEGLESGVSADTAGDIGTRRHAKKANAYRSSC